jgi:hypothetical protein
MGRFGGHHFQVIPEPLGHAPAPQIFFQAQFNAVKDGAGAAEGEDPAGPLGVVAHQVGEHGHRLNFRLSEAGGIFVPDDVGIEQGRGHNRSNAGDGGRRDDVHLGIGVAPHRHAPAKVHQLGGDLLHGLHLFRKTFLQVLLIASRPAAAQHRRGGFQIVHPIQKAGQGVDEIAVHDGVGDGVREAVFQLLQDFREVQPLLKITGHGHSPYGPSTPGLLCFANNSLKNGCILGGSLSRASDFLNNIKSPVAKLSSPVHHQVFGAKQSLTGTWVPKREQYGNQNKHPFTQTIGILPVRHRRDACAPGSRGWWKNAGGMRPR